MERSYNDVYEFMQIGQPDMVSKEMRAPDPSEGDAELQPLFSELLTPLSERMVKASKTLRTAGSPAPTRLGLGLMLEELGETIQAAEQGDPVEFADGLADLIYVTIWTALAHGINLPAVWDEVQRSNMEKFPICESCKGSAVDPTPSAVKACKIFGEDCYFSAREELQLEFDLVAEIACTVARNRHATAEHLINNLRLRSLAVPPIEAAEYILKKARELPRCPTCSGLGRVVIRDASGKVQKPPGWTPPDIKGALSRQGGEE